MANTRDVVAHLFHFAASIRLPGLVDVLLHLLRPRSPRPINVLPLLKVDLILLDVLRVRTARSVGGTHAIDAMRRDVLSCAA